MKRASVRRLLALVLILSVITSLPPTVFSEGTTTDEVTPAADILFRQIDDLCTTAAKRGATTSEAAFAALSDDVYALVEASGTAEPGSLAANGDFIRWVDAETGIPCCYSPEQEAVKAGMSASTQKTIDAEDMRDLLRSAERVISTGNNDCPQSLNVGLLQPFWRSSTEYKDSSFLYYSQYFLRQAELLAQHTGGELTHYALEDVTPDSIAYMLQSCGIVILNSHGSTDYSNGNDKTSRANSSYVWLTSASGSILDMKDLLNPEDYTTTHTGTFGTYHDVYFTGEYYCINGTVIANHMTADAPNSLVYFGCCLGMATDGLAAPLRERGVEAVIGFSQTVTFKGDYSYMLSITGSLLNDDDLAETMAAAKQEVGITDPYKTKSPCYPVVVSSADPYPGHGNVDAPQAVSSAWHPSTRRVSFSVPSTVSQLPAVYCGDGDPVTLPAAGDVDDYTFVGWSATPIGSESSVSSLLYENSVYAPFNNTTLYAVYTHRETHPGGYVKVTTAPTVFNGSYLIVSEADGIAFNASAQEPDASRNYISVTIEDQQIQSSTEVEAAVVTVRRVSGMPYYSVQLPDGRYIGNLGNNSGFNYSQTATETHSNNIVFNAQDQTVTIQNTAGNYTLLFHPTYDHFSYYLPNNANLRAISLYRKDSNALVDIYTTAPDTACAHDSWSTVVTASTCLHGGCTTKTCTSCGTVWTTDNTSALGHWFNQGVITPATDGSFGYTTYTCRRAGCGYSYQTDYYGLDYDVTLNVFGTDRQVLTVNSYNGAMLPDPEDTVSGYDFAGWSQAPIASESVTAALIDDLYYPMRNSTVYAVYSRCVDGVVFYSTTQAALRIHSASLILNGKIDIAFTTQLPIGYADPRMVVNGTELTEYSVNNGSYVFIYTGINPQCIGDSFTATLYATCNGTEESVSVENYSVRQYCVNKLRDGTISDELRTLLSDLLAYGEAAQFYMGYRLDSLITDGDDISDPMYSYLFYLTGYRARFTGTADDSLRWVNSGLSLTNSTAMVFRFCAEDIADLSIIVGLNGRTRTYTEFVLLDGETNLYEIVFDDISAQEFADEVSASFARNGVPTGNTLYYSVNAYVQSNLYSACADLSYLVSALYCFGASAREYANSIQE
ncbi:MAG: InlB B-repeat-containing protein [Oscillospiraceae bacterium]|nr:InlB B-repeat-containing protein [Oscillospiraceae bacterium]